MPGVERLTIDEAVREAERAAALDIPAIALFPYTDPSLRDPTGSESLNSRNLVCRAVREIKKAVPNIGIISDVALDPYTSHGHDGVMEGERILNDETVALLVAPGRAPGRGRRRHHRPLRHDGRARRRHPRRPRRGRLPGRADHGLCGEIRLRLLRPVPRRHRHQRDCLVGDKRTYQMDPANSDEALREVALDLDEGADMIMVKPGLPYLDIVRRVKDTFAVPTFAYQVSGEYAMIQAAAANGWIDGERAMMESLLAFKRAGADGILTYFAPQVAEKLKSATA